ncbi:MAG: O-antigen translocase [Gallionella sp.]|nr:O-antigen translocase [Gallionella sp.]
MSLIRTSLLNGVAVAVKVASALVLNKVLAVYVGPAGYAIVGQFQNVVSIVVSLAGGVVAQGVTKSTAQHFDNEEKQHAIWKTAIRFSLISSLIAGIALIFVGNTLAQWLLHRPDMSTVFVWLALALPAMAASNLLLAIVNGKKEVGIYVSANIIGSLLVMLLTGLLTFLFGLYGALVAFAINPAIILCSTALMVSRRDWFRAKFLWGDINRTALRELAGFGLMGLASALTVPIAFMLIRDNITTQLGITAAGYWQASWKISETYLMLVTSTLSVYFLPRLAEIRNGFELKTELVKVYKFVLPLIVIGAAVIFLLRDFIITTLFTEDFLPIRQLFPWQLVGDVIKIAAWITGYVLIGRGMVKIFLSVEIIFSASFVLLSWLFVRQWGLQGVPMAYVANYLLCWPYMAYWVAREMKRMDVADV